MTEGKINLVPGGQKALEDFKDGKPEAILQLLKDHPDILSDHVTGPMVNGILAKSPRGDTYFLRFLGRQIPAEAAAAGAHALSVTDQRGAKRSKPDTSALVNPPGPLFMVVPAATEPGRSLTEPFSLRDDGAGLRRRSLSPSPQDEINVPIFLDDEAVQAVREVLKGKQVRRGSYPIEFDRTRGF